MTRPESHYSPAEEDEVWQNWARALSQSDPELLEEMAQTIVDDTVDTTTEIELSL